MGLQKVVQKCELPCGDVSHFQVSIFKLLCYLLRKQTSNNLILDERGNNLLYNWLKTQNIQVLVESWTTSKLSEMCSFWGKDSCVHIYVLIIYSGSNTNFTNLYRILKNVHVVITFQSIIIPFHLCSLVLK